jgi:dienelactone hydrolase
MKKVVAPLLCMLLACCMQLPQRALQPISAKAGGDPGARIRADYLRLIDRPRVPADAAVQAATVDGAPAAAGLLEYPFSFAVQAGERVPGILIKPAGVRGRLPVVIVLHGTGGNKNGQVPFLRQLAHKGFLGVAIDAPYHGERATAPSSRHPNDYDRAILYAYQHPESRQHPFFIDTVWDMMRLIDYLETREDVDPRRIGMFGISKGGIETYLTAAIDTRVGAAVPCIGVESFRWAIDNDRWQPRIGTIQAAFDAAAKGDGVSAPDGAYVSRFYDRVATGIAGEFDGPAMVPLIAPRYLFVINGELDPRTPPPSLKQCTDAAEAAYRARDASDHLKVLIQPNTPHRVNPESQQQALEWLAACLHATAPPAGGGG